MPPAETTDLRALARVILDREDLEQAVHRRPRYELRPVSRRAADGARIGVILGLALGISSTGVLTPLAPHDPEWFAMFVLISAATTAIGTVAGSAVGVGVRTVQRRQLDRDFARLVDEHAAADDAAGEAPR
jgi:hypothetical protein